MPINPAAFRTHIEAWPHLFHVTSAAFIDDIRRNGLKPGSDLGRSTRNDFFQSRRGHVYLADRMTTAVVEVPGERVTLRVELVRLDPALVNSDEDLVQDSFSRPGGPWVSEPPPKRQMEDGREAPGQVGALARWAETTPEFDAPEVAAKSLAAGRIAYRGTVPPEALSVDEQPSEVAAFFVEAAAAALPDVVIADPPLHGFYAIEIARGTALAGALIDASIDTIAPGSLEPVTGRLRPETAEDLRHALDSLARPLRHNGDLERSFVLSAAADLAESVANFAPEVGWSANRDACVKLGQQAGEVIERLAEAAGAGVAAVAAESGICALVAAG